jgi:hypothetical protein
MEINSYLLHFMPLHIFLGDDILFEFKLVFNLQKGLKIYNGFSIFLRRIGSNSRWRPSWPSPVCGPHGPAHQHRGLVVC